MRGKSWGLAVCLTRFMCFCCTYEKILNCAVISHTLVYTKTVYFPYIVLIGIKIKQCFVVDNDHNLSTLTLLLNLSPLFWKWSMAPPWPACNLISSNFFKSLNIFFCSMLGMCRYATRCRSAVRARISLSPYETLSFTYYWYDLLPQQPLPLPLRLSPYSLKRTIFRSISSFFNLFIWSLVSMD